MNFKDALALLQHHLNSNKIKILNQQKALNISNAYKHIKTILDKDCNPATLEILPGALDLGDVFIRIITPQLTFYNTTLFFEKLKGADIIDIYTSADNHIKIDILFQSTYFVDKL